MNVLHVLHVFVAVCAGLRAGGNMFIHFGVNRITAHYTAGNYVHWLQDEVGTIGPYMGITGLLTLASAVVTLLAGRVIGTLCAGLTLVGILGSVADILITLRGNVPINHVFSAATAEQPPANWELLRKRWQDRHALRTVATFLAFLAYVLAASTAGLK